MHLLPRADAHDLGRVAGSDGVDKICQLHAGNARHVELAAVHLVEAVDDELDRLLEGDPEARHVGVGNRQWEPCLDPLAEERDH